MVKAEPEQREETNEEVEFQRNVAEKIGVLTRTYGEKLQDIFTWLPENKRAEFEATIQTSYDRDMRDIIIDFVLQADVPFEALKKADLTEAEAGEVNEQVKRALLIYASAQEARRQETPAELEIPKFLSLQEAISALKKAEAELQAAQKEFSSVLQTEERIKAALKNKTSLQGSKEVSILYNNNALQQMLELTRSLKSKAELVNAIADSQLIQNEYEKPTGLMGRIIGRSDSPAAVKNLAETAKANASKTIEECEEKNGYLQRFNTLKVELKEEIEIQKYHNILRKLMAQIPKADHQKIMKGGLTDYTLAAIGYLAKHGAVNAVAAHVQFDRIEGTAERISSALKGFNEEARARILDNTEKALTLGTDIASLAKATMDRDAKKGFSHFMEEFHKACKKETETNPSGLLKSPAELSEADKRSVRDMVVKLDEQFSQTIANASKPRPTLLEIIQFSMLHTAKTVAKNQIVQSAVLGAGSSALAAAEHSIAGLIGTEGAKLAVRAGQKSIAAMQRLRELQDQGNTPRIAGLIVAMETAIDTALPNISPDASKQKAIRDEFLSSVNILAKELQSPETSMLVEEAAGNKAIMSEASEDLSSKALIEQKRSSEVVSAAAGGPMVKPAGKAQGDEAKKAIVDRLMNVALKPIIEKLPESLQAAIQKFCEPIATAMVDTLVREAKTRLKTIATPTKAESRELRDGNTEGVQMPQGVKAAAGHIADSVSAFVSNQLGAKPAPLDKAAALAGIVAAGNIAGEAGINPDLINLGADLAARAAGLPTAEAAQKDSAGAARASSIQVHEVGEDGNAFGPDLAADARNLGAQASSSSKAAASAKNPALLPPRDKVGRSHS